MGRELPKPNISDVDRRHHLGQATAVAGAADIAAAPAADGPAVVNGRIKQLIVSWCFTTAGEMWDIDRMCQVARQLGVTALDSPAPELWPTMKGHGIACALAPSGMPGSPWGAVTTIRNITTK